MRFCHASLAAVALSLAFAGSAPAATTKILYSTSGNYAHDDCSMQIDCTPSSSYDGGATCSKNCDSGAPTSGTFSFDLSVSGSPMHPPGPCLTKKVQGSVTVDWSDGTTTTASITGSYSKKKAGYNLKVSVNGGSNHFIPPGPPVKGFVSHPPSPCTPGAFAGSLTFSH